jgi:geranylgeranyl pyrophosphate synthase
LHQIGITDGLSEAYISALTHVNETASNQPNTPDQSRALPRLFAAIHGGSPDQADIVAAAWVFLRQAARQLDDVQDSVGRKLSPTDSIDLNASVGLILSAIRLLQELEAAGVSTHVANEIRREFVTVALQTADGQHLDLTSQTPDVEYCLEITRRKSGLAAGLACWSGARLGSDDVVSLSASREFGICLGMLQQITDDLVDLLDDSADDLTRLTGSSLAVGYAFSVLPASEQETLRQLIGGDRHSAERARHIIIKCGAAVYLLAQTALYADRAREQLDRLDLSTTQRAQLLQTVDNMKLTATGR